VAGAQHCARRAFRASRSAVFRPRRPLAQQSRSEVVMERPRNSQDGGVFRHVLREELELRFSVRRRSRCHRN
jgi:hypothetical protein